MTIEEAINKLKELGKKYGDGIDVFFDCPKCNESFTPNTLVAIAAHFHSDKK